MDRPIESFKSQRITTVWPQAFDASLETEINVMFKHELSCYVRPVHRPCYAQRVTCLWKNCTTRLIIRNQNKHIPYKDRWNIYVRSFERGKERKSNWSVSEKRIFENRNGSLSFRYCVMFNVCSTVSNGNLIWWPDWCSMPITVCVCADESCMHEHDRDQMACTWQNRQSLLSLIRKINQEAGTDARTITTDSSSYCLTNDIGEKYLKSTETKQWKR